MVLERGNTRAGELPRIIVIDGEPGAGKTTQSELIAHRLGYGNVTAGMFFCAGGAAVASAEVDMTQVDDIAAAALGADITFELIVGRKPLVSVNGIDVSDSLFSQTNKGLASKLGAIPGISSAFEQSVRNLASTGQWVFDRGLATLPDADLKIWLDASPYARAVRRCGQLAMQGEFVPLGKILAEHTRRERLDKPRQILPPGTIRIDTSHLEIEEVYSAIAKRILPRAPTAEGAI